MKREGLICLYCFFSQYLTISHSMLLVLPLCQLWSSRSHSGTDGTHNWWCGFLHCTGRKITEGRGEKKKKKKKKALTVSCNFIEFSRCREGCWKHRNNKSYVRRPMESFCIHLTLQVYFRHFVSLQGTSGIQDSESIVFSREAVLF